MKRERLNQNSAPTNSSLDDDLIEEFCDLIKRGLPVDGVCDYIGINSSTFWVWIRKGEQYLESAIKKNGVEKYEIYGRFTKALRRAMAEYRLDRVDKLHNMGGQAWIRELAILERRDRKSFGKQDQPGGTDAEFNADERFL